MDKPWTCRKCGAPMHGPNDHDTTAGCNVAWPSTITTGDTSGYATSGPTIWGSEEARRLSRYDEAVRLIERLCTTGQDAFEWHKALEDGLDFIAAEQKEEDANTNTYGYLRRFRP